MPGFDGSGPRGTGAMTGRGLGYCALPVGVSPEGARAVLPGPSAYGANRRPLSAIPDGFGASYRFPFKGSRGVRRGIPGRSFGRGTGFGRRWRRQLTG